jgi:hypothetical protein
MKDKTMDILEKYLDNYFRVSPMAENKSAIEENIQKGLSDVEKGRYKVN